jgi:hypothetical protein
LRVWSLATVVVLALAGTARADGTAIVVDASESSKRAGAEKVEQALTKWLEGAAADDVRVFGTGVASELHRASARAAFPHEWGGASDLGDALDRAEHWLAAVPGEKTIVVVSDLELDVVGPDDAAEVYLSGLPQDADRETINRHAHEVFTQTTLPRLKQLGVKPVIVKLALPPDAKQVSLEEDLAGLPGATILDGAAAQDLEGKLGELLPKKAPPPPPPPPPPVPVPPPPPPPPPVQQPPPPPVTASVPAPEENWQKIAGLALIVVACASVAVIVVRRRATPLGERRLVPLGSDGKPLAEEIMLERKRTKRGVARLEIAGGTLELRARKQGGVEAHPEGINVSIEGVPINSPTALVHGMVLEVEEEEEGKARPFVYLERAITTSEKKRSWVEASHDEFTPLIASGDPGTPRPAPDAKDKKKKGRTNRIPRGFLSASKESLSDVASVEEILVIDDSQDTTQQGSLMFGERQILRLDERGSIAGEPEYFRTKRLDEASAVFELAGERLVFTIDEEAGAHLVSPGPGKVTIEGVPVGPKGATLVHAMVFKVAGEAYVYLEREPKQSERVRHYGSEHLEGKDSVSDVSSIDDIYVMDESDEKATEMNDDEATEPGFESGDDTAPMPRSDSDAGPVSDSEDPSGLGEAEITDDSAHDAEAAEPDFESGSGSGSESGSGSGSSDDANPSDAGRRADLRVDDSQEGPMASN